MPVELLSSQSKRVWGYDLIKALSMVMVVFYHLKSIDWGEVRPDTFYWPNLNKALYGLLSASIPLFFMVNGALMGHRKLSIQDTIKKCARLLLVWGIWTLVFGYGVYPNLFGKSLNTFYWFLPALAQLYFVNMFLCRNRVLKWMAISFIVVFPFITNLYWTYIISSQSPEELPVWYHSGCKNMYAVVYFYLGHYLSKRKLPLWLIWTSLILGLLLVNYEVIVMTNHFHVLYDGVNASFPTLGGLCIAVGLFGWLKSLDCQHTNVRNSVSFVGRNTIGIYMFHVIFIYIIQEFWFHYSPQPVVIIVLLTSIIIYITAWLSELILKSRVKFLLQL